MTAVDLWTIVQHSGYGYAGKEGFSRAVEIRSVRTVTEKKTVEAAGGVLFASYAVATAFEDTENFFSTNTGLYPHAQGTFSKKEIDGLRIYIPKAAE